MEKTKPMRDGNSFKTVYKPNANATITVLIYLGHFSNNANLNFDKYEIINFIKSVFLQSKNF